MNNANRLDSPLRVFAVVGSLGRTSAVGLAIHAVANELRKTGCEVDLLDLATTPLPLFNPETTYQAPGYPALKECAERADVFLLGTPDYHGCMSGAMKNFLDHFWREFGGKLFASVVSGYDKGLTVADQIRTVARQCYAWSIPYTVSLSDREDVRDGDLTPEFLGHKVEMLARDIRVYGNLLAGQRQRDLTGVEPGFLAKWRGPKA